MPDEQPVILSGWRAIRDACGLRSVVGVKALARKYKMPYVRLNHRVTISRLLLQQWISGLCQVMSGEEDRERGTDRDWNLGDFAVKGRLRFKRTRGVGRDGEKKKGEEI